MATATAANNGICHLFRLSAELRNRIYRDVLVEDDEIPIDTRGDPEGAGTADRFAQPGVLRTCRQIRSEAASIYYLENQFGFELVGVDAGKLIAFCKQASPYWRQSDILQVFVPWQSGDWGNLVEWLQAHYENRAPSCSCEDDLNCGGCLVSRMFELVEVLDPAREMRWEGVEKVLSAVKYMVESAYPDRWFW
ncbi:hypothetical protein PRZ48_010705 [Zasmidium cellare]|uniref:Uncharacterized protein n=1 Tax=Zasmidium cellare TaxID=395010 RepID=A0ABR0E9F9_ZASCE|nr:hypothetical protein PRZ48_010705 [Zasmidium cellare]